VGRLQARSLREVQAALAVMGEQLRVRHAEVYGKDSGYTLAALPLHDVLVERVRPVVLAAFVSLSLVLLIAAANTAALCFARPTRMVAPSASSRIRSAASPTARSSSAGRRRG
jgi:hypothetical protein